MAPAATASPGAKTKSRAAAGKNAAETLDYKTIAAQFAAAKRAKEAEEAKARAAASGSDGAVAIPSAEELDARARAGVIQKQQQQQRDALEARRKARFESRWLWTIGFWVWVLCIHATGILVFTSGFLLTRLVLDEKSSCADPPTAALDVRGASQGALLKDWAGRGTVEGGCWHPRTFSRAVVIIIDALRYDFTVPVDDAAEFHNALPFLHKTALERPSNAFLRPFIADPPTSTLQRLKGLTTGTLPTFVDLGSNFAGTAIEEDNLLSQLRSAGRKMVHLGDDTWTSLFPGYFEPSISRAYDSFNVWDLHTVDEGVIEHIFPLMRSDRKGDWDVLFGHLLGVDHAGHRYGPAHPAMMAKLRQMDDFVKNLTATIDDDTLLVVMGDHGMDGKGDHGGESDDEVEAALWMYSSRPVFGRTDPSHLAPPPTAKVRPVNQIDLVPTLALLLGIPIPYNNLGQPIEDAFAGKRGDAFENLAAVSRVATAGIRRYLSSYFAARGLEPQAGAGSAADAWSQAEEAVATAGSNRDLLRRAYGLYSKYQAETLTVCKDLWARFDIPSMVIGIANMALGLLALLLYISRGSDDDDDDGTAVGNSELDLAERKLELEGFADAEADAASKCVLERKLFLAALAGAVPGAVAGLTALFYLDVATWQMAVGAAAATSIVAVIAALFGIGKKTLTGLLPTSFWGWYSVVVVVSQSIGFASNSYTIWEDSITLFFLATFGLAAGISAMRLPGLTERTLGVYHAVIFVVLGRLASLSKLCREEQMPYCTSTYYASATSSTSAPWQLAIPVIVFLALPSVIKGYMVPSRSYEGLAPTWIGYIFRTTLFMICLYWTLDAADNGGWLPASAGLPEGTLKALSVYLAQLTLAVAVVAGSTAFIWAPPCVSIITSADPRSPGRAQITVLGYGNAHGARYLLLPINMLAALLLLTKPVGQGALALMLWQLLSLVEMLDLNSLGPGSSSAGPTVLALLASFHFFKTGHQAALSSIQWDAAFVPLFSIRYPWSPLLVALNTFAPHFLAAAALPLLVVWKVGPKGRGLLGRLSARAAAVFVAYFAVQSVATMAWAAHLRRHLMLFRVFCPRFMMGAAVLLLVDIAVVAVSLVGFRCNSLAVAEVFGWAE
ncbi:hypothetical protein RB595_005634 [Gaeumannomyces hyphopodioides]